MTKGKKKNKHSFFVLSFLFCFFLHNRSPSVVILNLKHRSKYNPYTTGCSGKKYTMPQAVDFVVVVFKSTYASYC